MTHTYTNTIEFIQHIEREYDNYIHMSKEYKTDILFTYVSYLQSGIKGRFEELCRKHPNIVYDLLSLYKHIDGIKPLEMGTLYSGLRQCSKNIDLAKYIIELHKTDGNYKEIDSEHIKFIFTADTYDSIELRKYLVTQKNKKGANIITDYELRSSIGGRINIECLEWTLNLYKENLDFNKIPEYNINTTFTSYCYEKQYDKAKYLCNLHNINPDYNPIPMKYIIDGFQSGLYNCHTRKENCYWNCNDCSPHYQSSYDFVCMMLDLHNKDSAYEPMSMTIINEYLTNRIDCTRTLDKLINLYREDPAYMMIDMKVLMDYCYSQSRYIRYNCIKKLILTKYLHKNDFIKKLIYL